MTSDRFGTREWSNKTVNCCSGCSHDCVYCYAKAMAIRFGRMTAGKWKYEEIRKHDVYKNHRDYGGTVMFPSSHDITPTNLGACLSVIENLLEAGNDILIVSKPHISCVKAICRDFKSYNGQMIFRFTIGARDDNVLSFWEPGAPPYNERKSALKYAYDHGFETSVSVEPMLDSVHIDDLIENLLPFVSETMWIGKMNHIGRLARFVTPKIKAALRKIEDKQSDRIIKSIWNRHKRNSQIKWKESIRKVVRAAESN